VTVLTDAQGFYSLQGLPVNTYDVEINKAGSKRSIQSGLVLSVNDVLKLDVVLELGSAEEKVRSPPTRCMSRQPAARWVRLSAGKP
jgi:Carboxypeptidase regulatory-like domain